MANQPVALARITPAQRFAPAPTPNLSPREKAAVIVRFLLAEGSSLPLEKLPESMQTALTEQMGQMRLVDRRTLGLVVEEFLSELDQVGLFFPGGIEGALSMMDGHISPSAASRLRRMAGASGKTDPWERLTTMPITQLLKIVDEESVEIAAVMLSKLPVAKSAEILGKLSGERARRVAYAVSMTGNVDPATVQRIGKSLASQLDSQPLRAFEASPVDRVGAILNISGSQTREDVLKGLEAADAGFAEQVRRAIFTFVHLPHRLPPRDVPKVIRILDQSVLITALAAAQSQPDLELAAEFLLANMSQRMAQGLREEILGRGKIKDKDADEAMGAVITAIRQLQASGEITLITDED
ncbi:MAG: FliG C-terminal domain-containing protein [Cypionkella sp.]